MNAISLQRVAASVASEPAVDTVLQHIVAELHAQPNVALARVWLLGKNESCDVCARMRAGGEPSAALHLVAGAGKSLAPDEREDWSKLTGHSRCIQLGSGKVGRIGATGESVFVDDAASDQRWSLNRDWVRKESIVSFAGHPLVYRNETVGVVVVFSRERLTQADFELLRAFADLAATAVAGARNFEVLERSRLQLETERNFLRGELDRIYAIGRGIAAGTTVGESPARPAAATLTREDLRRLEADNLRAALEEANWKVYGPRGAAERLGMKPTTLASRLKILGLRKPREAA